MKKISIITINLNNKLGLERTLHSVIEQTFSDYEFIVIDGDSTDGSKVLLNQFKKHFRHCVSEKDSGIYNAMNKGIQLASGNYFLFLNSGDTLCDPNTLANVFNHNDEAEIIYGNMIIDDGKGNKSMGKMPDRLTFKHMMRDTLWHPVSFISHAVFNKIGGYDEQLRITADYDFFLKAVLIEKVKTVHINLPVAVFVLDGISSQPRNRKELLKERRMVQLRYFSKSEIDAAQKITGSERFINLMKCFLK